MGAGPRTLRPLPFLISHLLYPFSMKGHTIQNRIDEGERISVYCHNPRCQHHAYLDLLKLRDKLGPDHGAMHDSLVPLLRCSKCQGKNVGIIIHQNTERKPDLRSPFQRPKG